MRFKLLLLLCLTAVLQSLGVRASTPGWIYSDAAPIESPSDFFELSQQVPPAQDHVGVFSLAPLSVSSTQSSTAQSPAPDGNSADEITSEIQNLADALQGDAIKIFEYVYNTIEYEHYYGSKKGAHLTLLEGAGNDMDQSSLLVALLRAAGHTAAYISVWHIVPYDDTLSIYSNTPSEDLFSAVSWLGLDPVPSAQISIDPADWPSSSNWTELDRRKSLTLSTYFEDAGFDFRYREDFPGAIITNRVIVGTVTTTGGEYNFDPSAKLLSAGSGSMDFVGAIGFDAAAEGQFLTSLGGTSNQDYAQGLDYSEVQSELEARSALFTNYIRANHSGSSVREIFGRRLNQPREISEEASFVKMFGLFQDIFTPEVFFTVEQDVMSQLDFRFNQGATFTRNMPELQGKRLSITSEGSSVNLWLDDSIIHTESISGTTFDLEVTARHPHFDNSTGAPTHDMSWSAEYKKNGVYALMYSYVPSERYLLSRQRILDGYIEEVRDFDPSAVDESGSIDLSLLGDADLVRKVSCETLNILGINWLYQEYQTLQILAALEDENLTVYHKIGRVGSEGNLSGGLFVDVGLGNTLGFPRDGIVEHSEAGAWTGGFLGSALEHGLIDQYNSTVDSAVSTVQIFALANASSDPSANRIYLADSSNWNVIEPLLNNYGSTSELTSKINAGATLLLPQSGDYGESNWSWSGYGFAEFLEVDEAGRSGTLVRMAIPGGFETLGGFSFFDISFNPLPAISDFLFTPNSFETGGISNNFFRSTPSFNFFDFYGADPVDMATGAMVFDKEDLSVGRSGVKGLTLNRHYSSARRNQKRANFGYGWTHNYDMRASVISAPEAGLGLTTPHDAAQMITAATMIHELMKDTGSPKRLVAGALIAKAAVDNLVNNAVSLSLGKESIQFIKQPDGSYTSPAGSTMSLSKNQNGDYILQEQHGNSLTFDMSDDGRISQISDQHSNTLDFTYSTDGLSAVTDTYNRSLTFSYTDGLITSVSDGFGRTAQYAYTDETLTTATDPEGDSTTFVYDGQHRLIEVLDGESRTIVVNRYNTESHVYEQDSEGDSQKTWELAFSGFRNSEIDPTGDSKFFFYDRRGRAVGIENGEGERTTVTYDGHDRVVTRVTPAQEVTTYSYDADHNLLSVTSPDGDVSSNTYDGNNRLLTTTDYRGHTRSFTYNGQHQVLTETDPLGHVVMTNTYFANGDLQSITDAAGYTTTFGYDTNGNRDLITYPDTTADSLIFNNFGDVVSHTDRRGFVTTYTYNNRRQLTSVTFPDNSTQTFAYDAQGNLENSTDNLGNTTSYTYSPTKKRLTTTLPTTAAGTGVINETYDSRDWLITRTDPLGHASDFTHDDAGRVILSSDPLSRATAQTFDSNGRPISRTNPNNETFEYTYNWRGDMLTDTNPLSHQAVYAFDENGNQTSLTNRRGHAFTFTYDDNNQQLTLQTPLGHTRTQVWNSRGLLESLAEASGQTTSFIYDSLGRVSTQSDPLGTIAFGYDDGGNLLTVAEGSKVLTRVYDNRNRVVSYTDAHGDTIGYAYDFNGNLTQLTYPDGKTVAYGYDARDQLTTITDWSNRVTNFSYDLNGRLTNVTRPNGTTRTIQYNAAGEVTRIEERKSNGRLLNLQDFAYDDAGRIEREFIAPIPQPYSNPAHLVTFDDDNRMASFNGLTIVYDVDGNMTSGPLAENTLESHSYDSRNRLTSAGGVTYGYDSENNRIEQIDAEGTTTYTIDSNTGLSKTLVRTRPDGSKTYYVYGMGLQYEVNEDDETLTYHYDFRGSTRMLTAEDGETVTDKIEYSPYGSTTYREGTTDTPFLFNGMFGTKTDPNGLLQMRARYFNPFLKRFINADPIGFAGGMNWFAYASGNPISRIDPQGTADGGSTIAGSSFGGNPLSDIFSFSEINYFNEHGRMYTGPTVYINNDYGAGVVSEIGAELTPVGFVTAGRDFLDSPGVLTALAMAPGVPRLGVLDDIGLSGLRRQRAVEIPSGQITESGLLERALDYLGEGYTEISPGRYLSADGARQFRYGAHEIRNSSNHHAHFEALENGRVVENSVVEIIADP